MEQRKIKQWLSDLAALDEDIEKIIQSMSKSKLQSENPDLIDDAESAIHLIRAANMSLDIAWEIISKHSKPLQVVAIR